MNQAATFFDLNDKVTATIIEVKPLIQEIKNKTREVRQIQMKISRKFLAIKPYCKVNMRKAILKLFPRMKGIDWESYYSRMVTLLIYMY